MDEFLQQLASGNLYAILATVGTALLTGEGGIIVWILTKFLKFKSYTAKNVSEDTIKGMTSINAKMVEDASNKAVAPVNNNLKVLTNNDKILAESLLYVALNDKDGLLKNVSKIQGVDEELVIQVDQKLVEEKQAEEDSKAKVAEAIAQLEKPEDQKIETL